MTTDHRPPPQQPSLRALARELGVNHSSLSAAARDGRLTHGVRLERGKVVVTDAAAAAKNWRAVHFRVDVRSRELDLEAERADERVRLGAQRLAATQPDAIVLTDVAMGCECTAAELFAERDRLSLLASALVADGISDRSPTAFKTRISKQLRKVAELHGAEKMAIGHALGELQTVLDLLASAAEDDESEETDDTDNEPETP